jgi:hypothetical protein
MMEPHCPSLVGHPREVAEYVSEAARFFTWAYAKYRQHDGFFQIGAAIDARLAAWHLPSSKSVH